jgi:hypothetical protein
MLEPCSRFKYVVEVDLPFSVVYRKSIAVSGMKHVGEIGENHATTSAMEFGA